MFSITFNSKSIEYKRKSLYIYIYIYTAKYTILVLLHTTFDHVMCNMLILVSYCTRYTP
jgi:hypothetical protein